MAKRKKILLTGASGSIGRLIYMHLGPWHDILTPTHAELDLLDRNSVVHYSMQHQHFDVIIHCAIRGADNVRSTDPQIAIDNLKMYYNLADYEGFYDKFINIASGCEIGYDVPVGIGHKVVVEELVTGAMPEFPYGMSKNIIARDVLNSTKGYNLRLWGILAQTRIFNRVWSAVVAGEKEFIIEEDKYMDYISEDDLAKIVAHYVNTDEILPTDINMVYMEKYKVSEVVQRYIDDNGLDIKIRVTGEADSNYFGSGAKLFQLGILK